MTFEELNIVREIKKQIADESQRLEGLKDFALSITPQFSRETYRDEKNKLQSFTCLNVLPKGNSTDSRVEKIAVLIADTEKNISDLKIQLEKETPLLIKKIQAEFPDGIEQRILINRYVVGKSFREISHIMKYSLRQIFYIHERILKRLHNVA